MFVMRVNLTTKSGQLIRSHKFRLKPVKADKAIGAVLVLPIVVYLSIFKNSLPYFFSI